VRLYIRSSLQETEAFRRRTHHPRLPEAARALVANWQIVVLGMLLVAMTTVPFSFVTVYARLHPGRLDLSDCADRRPRLPPVSG
jgi:hypothetical protein